ncbi:hypothetical protein CFOL_v3_27278, partial [Cephalotus follicularis]
VTKFLNSTTRRRNSPHLINVVRGRDESLRDYLTRFNRESLTVKDLEPSFALAALNNGLRNNSSFTFSLLKKPAVDMADLLRRAEKYVNAEEEMAAKKQKSPWSGHQEERGEHSRNAPRNKEKREERSDLPKDDLRHKLSKRGDSPRRGAPVPSYNNFAPLLDTRTRILAVEKDKVPIQWPEKMRSPAEKRDKEKYYRYHRDHGHDTEECRQLKNQIEDLIRKGHLRKYVDRDSPREEGKRLLGNKRSSSSNTEVSSTLSLGGSVTPRISIYVYVRQAYVVISVIEYIPAFI